MPSLDQLQAFVAAADQGSFSAASRSLLKAQSAVSTAVINLEIDLGVELFDRSTRSPRLTTAGSTLLRYARSVLQSNHELMAHAASVGEGVETQLTVAIEQGIFVHSLLSIFVELGERFPFLEVELLEPGTNDVSRLLQEGRADIGVMMEQEDYPQGFHFSGIGHSHLIPVCSQAHPLAELAQVSHADLRQHRQLVSRSRPSQHSIQPRGQKSPNIWFSESPYLIMELLISGLGWAELPQAVVFERLKSGELVRLNYDFHQTEILQGVDVVWTERRSLGGAGQWLLHELLSTGPGLWPG